MDPLSITAAIVTFIDIANSIRASVDKISDKRRTLNELTSDIVIELLELKMLSERRERLEDLDESHLDAELTALLENLQLQLTTVLERCMKTIEPRKHTRLRYLKVFLMAWIEYPKIEADIALLRDHVSSFHRRFTKINSIRMERRLLFAIGENRTKMIQMEGRISRHLTGLLRFGLNPPQFSHDMETQSLCWRVCQIVDIVSCVWAKCTVTLQDVNSTSSVKIDSRPSKLDVYLSAMCLPTFPNASYLCQFLTDTLLTFPTLNY